MTRLEESCVEVATAEQARALFVAGEGHGCTPGESIRVEFEGLLDD